MVDLRWVLLNIYNTVNVWRLDHNKSVLYKIHSNVFNKSLIFRFTSCLNDVKQISCFIFFLSAAIFKFTLIHSANAFTQRS